MLHNTELLGGAGREDLHTDSHFKEQKCLRKGRSGCLVPGQNSGKTMLLERWMDSRHAEYAGAFQFMRPLDQTQSVLREHPSNSALVKIRIWGGA